MEWTPATGAELCVKCHNPIPEGAQMAVFRWGRHLEHYRCATCERLITAEAARQERRRGRAIRFTPQDPA